MTITNEDNDGADEPINASVIVIERNIPTPTNPLSIPFNKKFPCNDSDVPNLSEDDIFDVCKTAPKIANGFGRIAHISENTIVKFGGAYKVDLPKARNMELVAEHAPSIRTPKMIRTFQRINETDRTIMYIVMEYIHGTLLSACWNDMSEDRRNNICNQVVEDITTLQALKLQTIGPIGGKKIRQVPHHGLFSSSGTTAKISIGDLERWYDAALDLCKQFRRVPQDVPVFKGSVGSTLAMTHLDIAP
jgi:hypothetical protein